MDIGVAGLLETGDGNLSGWGFSIDTFKIEIITKRFYKWWFIRRYQSPITGDGDYLNYKAILTKKKTINLNLQPLHCPTL